MLKGSMPVLVGVGQAVSHWRADDGLEAMPTTLSLAEEAARRAVSDTGCKTPDTLLNALDAVIVVRTMEDSIAALTPPFGRCSNLPGGLANVLGATPKRAIYSGVGGQSPQSLVNEFAAEIHAGRQDCVLIAGTENAGAQRAARKAGLKPDLDMQIDGDMEDRGLGAHMLTRTEAKHGLVKPAYFYGLFENAIAHSEGRNLAAHRAAMGDLFSKFSDVAAANPYAQFPKARSADFLATPSKENYPFADPFLKWHIAQDAVNLAAAVILMSEEKADALGVPVAARIYLHGGAEASDLNISERPQIDGSWAMQSALTGALDQAGKTVGEIDVFDLYSCFPCAVFSACDVLGIDWQNDPRALTQTGGLPFFGGPGNNYSLHGIASTVEALRQTPDTYGLVLANGGWMTKEAVGIYSAQRPDAFQPVQPTAKAPPGLDLLVEPDEGHIETYTIVNGRDGPVQAIVFARDAVGNRFLGTSRDPRTLAQMPGEGMIIGRSISVTTDAERNTFRFV